jgi:hypothetical protein
LSHVHSSSTQAGSAAATAERKKQQKYADVITGIDFVPVAIETSGVWGEQALELVTELGRRIAAVTFEPRSTAFLRQRISVAVQRGNAGCILGTFRITSNADEFWLLDSVIWRFRWLRWRFMTVLKLASFLKMLWQFILLIANFSYIDWIILYLQK